MASQVLEQVLSYVPRMGQEDRAYQTLDVYTAGVSHMYTGPMRPMYPDINPNLDGGLRIDLNKSTPNTTILKEDLGPIRNTYVHHDRGPGRMETDILNILKKPKK